MDHITRRRLLELAGAGAAGVVASRVVGEPVWGTAAGAVESGTEADPPEFRTRLTERYGMRYPIVQAGFSALYVTPELAAAVSNAGGLGCLGAAPEPAEGIRNLIRQTKALTSRPFGMDFVYFPMGGVTIWSPGYEDDKEHRTREINWSCTDRHIDVCIDERIAYVVFFWTAPEARWVKRLKAAGIPVWAQVGSVRGAREAVDWGADVIIAQGMQAGGHCRGYQDAEPTMRQELVARVKEEVPSDIVVLGAGGIADGRTLADALREGAEAAWVGTVFCASEESYAHDEYKRRVVAVENGWAETRASSLFGPEWPGGYTRSIMNRVMRQWQGREDQRTATPGPERIGQHRVGIYTVPGGIPYEMPKFSLMLPTRDTTGDFEEMCLLAGAESAPLVKSVQKAAEIVVQMGEGARLILNRRR